MSSESLIGFIQSPSSESSKDELSKDLTDDASIEKEIELAIDLNDEPLKDATQQNSQEQDIEWFTDLFHSPARESSTESTKPQIKKIRRSFTVACKKNAIELYDKYDLLEASEMSSVPARYITEWIAKRKTIENVSSGCGKRRVQLSPDVKLGRPMKHQVLEEKVLNFKLIKIFKQIQINYF